MNNAEIVKYFEDSAGSGQWNSMYNYRNPLSYSFIVRLRKALSLAEQFKNRNVLDLGCGTGVLMPFVVEGGGRYTGMDISRQMLDEARRIYPGYAVNDSVQLVLGDIRQIQLPSRFDTAIGLGFMEYFDEPDSVIKILYDRLAAGGRLILSFPNFYSLDYVSLRFLAPFRYLAKIIFGKFTYQPPRILWNIARARRLYVKAGFKNLKSINYNINIFSYPFTRMSMSFTNYWAGKFEYSALSKCSFFATGFLISGEKQ